LDEDERIIQVTPKLVPPRQTSLIELPLLKAGNHGLRRRPNSCHQIHSSDAEIKMSLSYSIRDFVHATQLAYSVVQNAKKACSAHSALAREINSLHVVLVRLESEVGDDRSTFHGRAGIDGCNEGVSDVKRQELAVLVRDCERVLRVLSEVLEKVRIDCSFTGQGKIQY
jgi:hypothetical protein